MNKFCLIFLTGFYLITSSVTHATETSSMLSEKLYKQGDPDLVLVLYDNPMEEHKVIRELKNYGYNVKIEKELNAAIEVLKRQAAKLGAHAVIVLSPEHSKSIDSGAGKDYEDKNVSAKAIRYKHFYY